MATTFNFRRRKGDTARYERAKKVLSKVTFAPLADKLKEEIQSYETESKIIEFFVNHPNLEVTEKKLSKDNKLYSLNVKLIAKDNDGNHYVKDAKMTCQLIGENYVEEWRNIDADYHSLHVITNLGGIDYWYGKYSKFLLEQLQHQDQLEEMCEQLNLMEKNYFTL